MPKPRDITLDQSAKKSVPLTTDVHGERVVFKGGYGDVQQVDGSDAPAADAGTTSLPLPQILAGEVHACNGSNAGSARGLPSSRAPCV